MFTWLHSQGVRSDKGFEVESKGKILEEYREANRKITIQVERGWDGVRPCLIIEPTAFERWDGDPPGTILPRERQAEMLRNFEEAMNFQGVGVSVERRFT